jgi:hypothetical protein
MKNELMVTFGYPIQNENELKGAIEDFTKKNPEIIYDGASKKEIIKLYRKRNKPYRHIVFMNIEGNWFIKFLTDKEVLHHIPIED